MNYKELAEKAREIKADGERFLAQYENEIVDFLREDAEDAESRLQKEIFLNFWIISMECAIWQNIWDWRS